MHRMAKVFQVLSYWPTYLLLRFFVHFEVRGQENLKGLEDRAVIFASNHASYLDGPISAAALPRRKGELLPGKFFPIRFLVHERFFRWRYLLVAFYVRLNGSLEVGRTEGDLKKSLSETIEALRNGEKIWIFPEGRMTRDGKLQQGRRGVAYLHRETGAPVVPVGISGNFGILSWKTLLRRNMVFVNIGNPIYSLDNPGNVSLEKGATKVIAAIGDVMARKSPARKEGNARLVPAKLGYMVFSDFYRFLAALFDWRSHLRALGGKPLFDVACITNFENELQKSFMGLFCLGRIWRYGLRFRLGDTLGRYIIIGSSARGLTDPEGKERGKRQVREAIAAAAGRGVKVILFAAYTKRLFSKEELKEIRAAYPGVAFTIGDNGTAWALLMDVLRAIELNRLNRASKIAVLGPSGFLGGTVLKALSKSGFTNLVAVGSRRRAMPFKGIAGVELVVACSHSDNLRLTAEIVRTIAGSNGIYVVDVCRPVNFSVREFERCEGKVGRLDAGVVFNKRLRYVFSPLARPLLGRLKMSSQRLYGCFSEAIASPWVH